MGIDHVGLGGDFLRQIARALGAHEQVIDGMRADATLEGLQGPEDYPALLAALKDRGYTDEQLAKLAGANLIRVLGRGLPA